MLTIHCLTCKNEASDVRSNMTTTPSARRKYCFVILRNLNKRKQIIMSKRFNIRRDLKLKIRAKSIQRCKSVKPYT